MSLDAGTKLFYVAADDRLVTLPIQMTPTFDVGLLSYPEERIERMLSESE